MIEFKKGDILIAEAEALVNTVNCVGVMGRGVALQFKRAFPENFKAYAAACRRGDVQPGRMFVFETGQLTPPRYIINFPTKRHWRGMSQMPDIVAGLDALVTEIRTRGIRSIALPPLGSGLGGLSWNEVRPLIERALAQLPEITAYVYEPLQPSHRLAVPQAREVPAMTPGRATLVGLIDRYLAGLMDPFVTLLEVHKLMYFMQEAGEPLRLRYVQALYGPYAENLRHVLREIEGHLTCGYSDDGDKPDEQLTLLPGAITDATTFLAANPKTRARFDRVSRLVQGFETPFGLELLATVHWVAVREGMSCETVIQKTYEWNERKRRFAREQIQIALGTLGKQGWLSPHKASRTE